MKCRPGLALAIMTFAVSGTACFDVHPVDAGPAVLDDFEDGDFTPSLRPFGDWYCGLWNPTASIDCTHGQGFQSSAGLAAAFTLVDPPDGEQQRGTVELETDSETPIDLTGAAAITLNLRLPNAPVTSPGGAVMRFQLRCSTAIGEDGAPLRDFVVAQTVPYTGEWASVSLALSNFGPVLWASGTLRGGTPACLRAVDGFQIVFDPGLPDGQTLASTLSIDNVRIQ